MARKNLLEDIKLDPTRIYRSPGDVLRDRRFRDTERLDILRAWQGRISDGNEQSAIGAMIVELEGRLFTASNHAAE